MYIYQYFVVFAYDIETGGKPKYDTSWQGDYDWSMWQKTGVLKAVWIQISWKGSIFMDLAIP